MKRPLREAPGLSQVKLDDNLLQNCSRPVTAKRAGMSARPNVAIMNSQANA